MEINLLAENPAFDDTPSFDESNLEAIEGCAEVARQALERDAHKVDEAVLNGAVTSLEGIPALVEEIRRMYKYLGVLQTEDTSYFDAGWLNFAEAVKLEAEYRKFLLSLAVDSEKRVCDLANTFKDRDLFWKFRKAMNLAQTTEKLFPKADGLDEALGDKVLWPDFPNKCAGDGFFYVYDDPIDACQGCPNCGDYGPIGEST